MLRSANGRAREYTGIAAIALALALAGCGSSSPVSSSSTASSTQRSDPTTTSAAAPATTTTSTTPPAPASTASTPQKSPEKVPNIDIPLKSSAARQPIAALYTCDGSDTPLPLRWAQVPPHTVELDLFVLNLEDANNKIFVDWGVAGLKPSLRALTGKKLPAGAIVARNSFGQKAYSICPPKGSKEEYAVLLDALTKRIPVKSGFNAAPIVEHLLHTEVSEGQLTFAYARG